MVTDIRTKIEERKQQEQKEVLIKRARTIFSNQQNFVIFSTLLRMIEKDPKTAKVFLDTAEEQIQNRSFETEEYQRIFAVGVLCGVVLGYSVAYYEIIQGILQDVEEMGPDTLRKTLLDTRECIEKHNAIFRYQ
jgi:hypothetical protein